MPLPLAYAPWSRYASNFLWAPGMTIFQTLRWERKTRIILYLKLCTWWVCVYFKYTTFQMMMMMMWFIRFWWQAQKIYRQYRYYSNKHNLDLAIKTLIYAKTVKFGNVIVAAITILYQDDRRFIKLRQN